MVVEGDDMGDPAPTKYYGFDSQLVLVFLLNLKVEEWQKHLLGFDLLLSESVTLCDALSVRHCT